MNGNVVFRALAALILVAAVTGIALFAYNAGVAKGSPVTIEAPSGETGQPPYYPYYGYGYPLHRPFGFGFGFLGCLVPLILFFLIFGAFRFLFWGPRWGWRHHTHGGGPWSMGWHEGVPPAFEEWHKRAHGEQPSEENRS